MNELLNVSHHKYTTTQAESLLYTDLITVFTQTIRVTKDFTKIENGKKHFMADTGKSEA